MLESITAFCLVVMLASVAALARACGELRRARAKCAVLETVPLDWFRWRVNGTDIHVSSNASGYDEFLKKLSAAGAQQLERAKQALQSHGTPFSLTFATGRAVGYAIHGRCAPGGDAVLWVQDASAAVGVQSARTEAADLRAMLDAVSLPVWRRGADGVLLDCNRAYGTAVDATPDLAVAESRDLVPQARNGECRHVIIGGSRRLVEIGEMPCPTGGAIGFAVDRTDREAAAGELWRHVNANAEVLEAIRASVTIYGPDKKLIFFNSAFASMWGLAEDWLAAQPSFEDVLERLRQGRCLPETADFREFKCEQLRLFTSVIRPQQDLLHLPDGRTLLLSISPHPFGGLTFVYEDVSDRLALERSCNTSNKVRRATLDHLFEAIAVYGSDGRLKLHNPAYLALWELSQDDVAGEPHIGEIIEKTRALLDDGGDWSARKERSISKVITHALASGLVHRADGSILQEATAPLPDGDVLLTYLDVTDTVRYERVLRERNEALETAGRLKSEFIANASHEVRTPLNAVIGFADILTNQYFGDLNPRQLEYSRGILQSSEKLLGLINDNFDLAMIEAGHLVLERRRFEVMKMLQTVLSLNRARASARQLEIELCCPPNIGTIEADERRLKQALFNLVSNAIKFTPPGGSIRLAAERCDGELLLTVADTELGTPLPGQAQMPIDLGTGTPRLGAGLGLSLVKSLFELHGGTVAIDVAAGRGTTIICRLPAAPSDFAGVAAPDPIESRQAA